MTFRASNVIASNAYDQVRQTAVNLKAFLQKKNTEMAAGAVGFDTIQAVAVNLTTANTQFNTLKTTPGLADYAIAQENDNLYDVAAEFTAMQSAISAALAWMDTNVPTTGNLSEPSTWTTSSPISDTFSPAATAGFRTTLDAVINAIS